MTNKFKVEGGVAYVVVPRRFYAPVVALIDERDLPLLAEAQLHAQRCWDKFYVRIRLCGKGKYLQLHRFLTSCPTGLVVDHLNDNPLDNRRVNLEIVTQGENIHRGFLRGRPRVAVKPFARCQGYKKSGPKFLSQSTTCRDSG